MINLHTHTARCGHAAGTDREYVEAAVAAGYREIGFSDHTFFTRPAYSGEPLVKDEAALNDYVRSIRSLREEYADRIRIRIGLEYEYVPETFRESIPYYREHGIEYFILGQHFAYNDTGGFTYAGRPNDSVRSFDRYVRECLEGMSTGVFTYLAHPDLFNFTGDHALYKDRMKAFARELKAMGVQLEYNRLGFFERRNYPAPDFWAFAAAENADVCIGLDAHSPDVYADHETVRRMHESLASLGLKHRDPAVRPNDAFTDRREEKGKTPDAEKTEKII